MPSHQNAPKSDRRRNTELDQRYLTRDEPPQKLGGSRAPSFTPPPPSESNGRPYYNKP